MFFPYSEAAAFACRVSAFGPRDSIAAIHVFTTPVPYFVIVLL